VSFFGKAGKMTVYKYIQANPGVSVLYDVGCSRLIAVIAGSIPAESMAVRPSCLLCVV
jgi:hypothetical protein